MKKSLIWTAVAVVWGAAAWAVEVDGITATVGDTSILRSDVLSAMRRRGETDESRYDAYRTELIERTLILKAAEEAKVSMQDWVVKDRIRSIIENSFGGDRNKLVATLAKERVSMTDWERQIKEDLIVNAMRWNSVYKNVRVSPAEMKAEFEAHPERYQANPKVTVSVILLRPDDVGRREEVAEFLSTNSFAAAAAKYSADTHAKEGGVWKDVVPSEVFKPAVCDEIAKMPKGTISNWVDIDGWSFLLRKDDETVSTAQSFADAYDAIADHVREANAARLTQEWIERLKANAYIRVY